MMHYIIMADGKGKRWDNFTDRPKHLIEIEGETLLARLVRQIRTHDKTSEITITARDDRYEVLGAKRHVPLDNKDEIDRFTSELIKDNACFLYGDTCYTDEAIAKIVDAKSSKLLFFGNEKRIIAVKVFDGACMKKHVEQVKNNTPEGKGWHVYQVYSGLKLYELGNGFFVLEDGAWDFNTPEDYLTFIEQDES